MSSNRVLCLVILLLSLLTSLSDGTSDGLSTPHTSLGRERTAASASTSSYPRHRDARERLHIAVMSVPMWGHFKPLWAIAEELAHRGHTLSIVVEEPTWCTTLLEHSRHTTPMSTADMTADNYARRRQADGDESENSNRLDIHCVVVSRHPEVFGRQTFQPMTREGASVALSFLQLFDDIFRHHELSLGEYVRAASAVHGAHPIHAVLCDIVTYACASAARKLHLPVVQHFPFTTQLAIGVHPLLPAIGLGLPRHMRLYQRILNFAFKCLTMAPAGHVVRSLNKVRANHGIPPFRDAYDVAGMYGPLLTPTLWGLDIPQPLCPNVHPVGPLNTREQRQPFHRNDLPDGLASFLDNCPQGVVYVNWGTLSAPSASMEATLLEGLVAAAPFCVAWKRRSAVKSTGQPASTPLPPGRFFVTSWLSSPAAVLKHPNTVAFLSHCGDTSVLEAVEAEVPIIGFPLFADQADVCQRVTESGIGVQMAQTKTFTPADVQRAVITVTGARTAMAKRLRELHWIAEAYGGVRRAADIVEERHHQQQLQGDGVPLQICRHLDGALRVDYMLLVWAGALLIVTAAWSCLFRWLIRCICGRVKALQHGQAAARPPKAHKQL